MGAQLDIRLGTQYAQCESDDSHIVQRQTCTDVVVNKNGADIDRAIIMDTISTYTRNADQTMRMLSTRETYDSDGKPIERVDFVRVFRKMDPFQPVLRDSQGDNLTELFKQFLTAQGKSESQQ